MKQQSEPASTVSLNLLTPSVTHTLPQNTHQQMVSYISTAAIREQSMPILMTPTAQPNVQQLMPCNVQTTPDIVSETIQQHNVQQNNSIADQVAQTHVLNETIGAQDLVFTQNDEEQEATYFLRDDEGNDVTKIQAQHILGLMASIVEKQSSMETRMELGMKQILDKLSALESMWRTNPTVFSQNSVATTSAFVPIDSVDKLKEFEEGLKNDEFVQNAVSYFLLPL